MARHNQLSRDSIYKEYVAEALRIMSENTAKSLGGEGSMYLSKSYIDIVYGEKEPQETADEIIERIKDKLGGY